MEAQLLKPLPRHLGLQSGAGTRSGPTLANPSCTRP